MLHSILFYLVGIPATFIISAIAVIFGKSFGGRPGSWCQYLWGLIFIKCAGVRLKIDTSALEPGRTYIFMANHQSMLDIGLLSCVFVDYNIRFVAKKELLRIPIFGWSMKRVGQIAIDRDNARKAMRSIEEAAEAVKAGTSIAIFPEGTRGKDYSGIQEFKIGGMILALKCNAPVVPVIVTGTGDIKMKGSWRIQGGEVTLTCLPPIDAAAKYSLKEREKFKDDLHKLMSDAYRERIHGR